MEKVKDALAARGVSLTHGFINDGNPAVDSDKYNVIAGLPTVNHGMDWGILTAYKALLATGADIIIKIDSQEHDPWIILDIVDAFEYSNIQAMFLPVWYRVEGQPRSSMRIIYKTIDEFYEALSPIRAGTIADIFNQKFPMGFQAWRRDALMKVLPILHSGVEIYETTYGNYPRWIVDLLAMIVARSEGLDVDFMFAGFSTPWRENRPEAKIQQQMLQAQQAIEIASLLGYKIWKMDKA